MWLETHIDFQCDHMAVSICLHGDRDSKRAVSFVPHTVLDQCVVIQAMASIFSPAQFSIWCTIGDIILRLSSQGVAVFGHILHLSTGHHCESIQGLWVLKCAGCFCPHRVFTHSYDNWFIPFEIPSLSITNEMDRNPNSVTCIFFRDDLLKLWYVVRLFEKK